jgi:hypothetical protein
MPGVPWRPLASNWASQPALSAHHIVCLHTMVGSLSSAENYFRLEGYGGAESHFGVGYNGTIYQWQDTEDVPSVVELRWRARCDHAAISGSF